MLIRVEAHPTTVQLVIKRTAFFKRPSDGETELAILKGRLAPSERIVADGADAALARVTLPRRLKFQGGKVWLTDLGGGHAVQHADPDDTLIKGLRAAHALMARCGEVPVGRPESLVLQSAPASPYDRNLARLAFLAPDIQALILEGRQPPSLTLTRLLTSVIPSSWEDQRRAFDIPC